MAIRTTQQRYVKAVCGTISMHALTLCMPQCGLTPPMMGFLSGAVEPEDPRGGVQANGQCPVAGTGEIISVPAVTLNDFIATVGPVPQLVKIDVEGGEYAVLRGGRNLFANHRPLIIAEVHHQQAADQIGVWLGQYQYCAQWNIPKENFPRCLYAWPTEYDGAEWMQKIAGLQKPLPTPHSDL